MKLPDWHEDMLHKLGDIFTAAVMDAMWEAQSGYVQQSLSHMHKLETGYGAEQSAIVRGLVRHAAKRVGMTVELRSEVVRSERTNAL